MTYPATNLNEAVGLIVPDSNAFHDIINGTSTQEVTLPEGDTVPTVRKAFADSLLFKNPIAWDEGNNATDSLQLRTFTDNLVYWAPNATVSNPVPMRVTPVGDNNWKLAPVAINKDYIDEQDTASEERLLGTGSVLYKGSNGSYVQNGDVIPVGTTHLSVFISGKPEDLSLWGDIASFSSNQHAVSSISSDGFGAYDIVTDAGSYKFITEFIREQRQLGFLEGWGYTVIAADIKPYVDAALSDVGFVKLKKGTYSNLTMIEIGTNKGVHLEDGVDVVKSSAATDDDPVFWLNGNNASLTGAGMKQSRVRSQRKIPDGVVLIGHRTMLESHANVNYCQLNSLRLGGGTAFGQTDGSNDIPLVVQNPQFDGYTSYFHNINNMMYENANKGIEMRGWANGITGSNHHGYRLGNSIDGEACFLHINGALDNTMSNFFFHQSPDSTGVLVDEYDNTGNGGSLHQPRFNSIRGFTCEQGGASARGLVSNVDYGSSYFEIMDNVAGGNSYSEDFAKSNTIVLKDNITSRQVQSDTILSNKHNQREPNNNWVVNSDQATALLNMSENTSYKVLDVDLTQAGYSVIVRMTHAARVNGFNQSGGGVVEYMIKNFGGVVSAAVISNKRSGGMIPNEVQVSGTVATISMSTPNNGTSSTGHNAFFDIEITGRRDSTYSESKYSTLNIASGTTPAVIE